MGGDSQIASLLAREDNDSVALSSRPVNSQERDSTESVIPVESLVFPWRGPNLGRRHHSL